MQPTELTLKQYKQQELTSMLKKYGHIKNKVLESNKKMTLERAEREWCEAVKELAKTAPLPNKIINSFLREYGENAVFHEFRGIYAKGISEWRIPKKVLELRKQIS